MSDSPVHGILQARILEWVAGSFSRESPNPGIEPRSPTLQVDSLPAELSKHKVTNCSIRMGDGGEGRRLDVNKLRTAF